MTIHKIIHPCTAKGIPVFCEITYKNGNLSIIGVEGPTKDGNCAGGCGQIDVSMRDYPPESVLFRPGWNAALFRQFLDVWEKWHLNDMRAGCEHQRTIIKEAMWVKESEHPEDILCKPCPVCGYKYGTAWLKEDVPADILDFLRSLPDADRSPAWI